MKKTALLIVGITLCVLQVSIWFIGIDNNENNLPGIVHSLFGSPAIGVLQRIGYAFLSILILTLPATGGILLILTSQGHKFK